MKDLYLEHKAKPRPAKTEEFISHCISCLASQGLQVDRERVLAALAILDARRQHPRTAMSPWQMANGTIMQPTLEQEQVWNSISDLFAESEKQRKIAMGEIKPQSEQEKEQVHQALETIKEFVDLEPDEHQTKANKLLRKNFDELAGGGLSLREGVTLTVQDALEAAGIGVQQYSAAGKFSSSTFLRLGDILNAVESQHGEIYTQVVETSGKSFGRCMQARMTSKYYPARKRAELDPQAVLSDTHWTNTCVKTLSDEDRESLIKLAVKRSSTKEAVNCDYIKQMASGLQKIPADMRAEVLEDMDSKMETAKEGLNLLRHNIQILGGETGARRRYLYICYPQEAEGTARELKSYPGWQKLTNDYSLNLAMEADLVIYLPSLKVMEGPDTFTEILFQYVSPEVIEADPKHPLDIEVYADYRIVEDGQNHPDHAGWMPTFHAVGTKNGKADVFQIVGAQTPKDALEMLRKLLKLTDGRDKLGRLYQIKSDPE
jgi:hypothetical protein